MRIYEPKCKEAGIAIERNFKSTRRVVLAHWRDSSGDLQYRRQCDPCHALGRHTLHLNRGRKWPCASRCHHLGEDNGVGISNQQLPKIFDAFFSTRVGVGTGIGLFVAKQFVIGHGGKIDVESTVDPASMEPECPSSFPSRIRTP